MLYEVITSKIPKIVAGSSYGKNPIIQAYIKNLPSCPDLEPNKIRLIIRKRFGIKKIKVGHAGTLDPLATGLVIVCTGKATKQIDQYQGMEKEYVASVCLGATTPSQDLESEIDQRFPYEHITQASLEEALQSFVGDNDQIPPVFSAIKIV